MDKGLCDEESGDMEEGRKEHMDLMGSESKPHFTNI